MKDDFQNVYELIEHALELAFEGKMQFVSPLRNSGTNTVEVNDE